jgi:tRNA A-37 threonylcarbamoyl transferase component Bud32
MADHEPTDPNRVETVRPPASEEATELDVGNQGRKWAATRARERATESSSSSAAEPTATSGTTPATGFTSGLPRSAATGVTTASSHILRSEEHARTLALYRLVIAAGIAASVVAWLPTRVSPGRLAATVVSLFTVAVTAYLLYEFRDATRFDTRKVLFQGVCCVLSILTVVYYVGVFSPTIVAMYVGIYFFGQSDSPAAGWIIYATGAFGYLVLDVLCMVHLIPTDQSVLALKSPELASMLAVTLVCQVLFLATFWMARRSRAATLGAFQRLERAARQIRKRDALLDEARADLERERAANQGRFTDQQIGKWIVGEVIGRGAMGEVYKGWEVDSKRQVALKFLSPAMIGDPTSIERFFAEAEVVGRLESPHIVKVLDRGVADGGSPFLVMEYLEGRDLARILREQKRLGTARALELVSQVAQALAAAEEGGIVHRDLKPQNLFFSEAGGKRIWKVLDFGVAKVLEGGKDLTMGAAVGTPSYMSPEQARGEPVDHRADVFALGVVAYRVLTGRPAFTGPESASTLYNVVHVQPVRPGEVARLSRDIERVLAIALAKDRTRRFSSSMMFAAALREAARDNLDERLRRDADALLEEQPWGADLLQMHKHEAKPWGRSRHVRASRASAHER